MLANGLFHPSDQRSMRQPSQSRPGQGYHLGIDLGPTCTAAAVCRAAEHGRPEAVALGDADAAIATAAFLADDGALLVGEAARRRSAAAPQRVVRGFVRRIGDNTPLVLGDHTPTAAEIAARFVRAVVELVSAREGGAPDTVALTHPTGWGAHRLDTFTRALAAVGLVDVLLVSEPAAAALGHTGAAGLAAGAVLAVYDLGGDSFEASVLGGGADGDPLLLGRPVGIAGLGGVDFDEHVLDHVRDTLGDAWNALDPADPDVLAAVAALRRDCATAKEALSADVDAAVPVMLPGAHTRVRIGRADFEDRIRGDVAATVEALLRALAAARIDPAVPQTILLVGGSSRIPLVPQLVSAGLGRPITVDADPRTTVARGAALAAHRQARPAEAVAEMIAAEMIAAEMIAGPVDAPQRPVVPQLRTAAPAWPAPAGRPLALRVRGVLVAALATVGIALAAAATAYTVDPTLLAGEAPVALVEPVTPPGTADVPSADAGSTAEKAEQPAEQPVVAAPVRAGAAPARHVARAARPAAIPTAAATPVAAPPTAAPAPIIPPTSAAPPAPSTGAPGPGDAGTDPPPADSGGLPTGAPPPGQGAGNVPDKDGPATDGGKNTAQPTTPAAPVGKNG